MGTLSSVQEIQNVNKYKTKKVGSTSNIDFFSFNKRISSYFKTVITVNFMLLEISVHSTLKINLYTADILAWKSGEGTPHLQMLGVRLMIH